MSTTNQRAPFYTTSNSNDRLFQDEQIQRFDADTIQNRYGENWRTFASNVREIAQPDGSIVKGLRFAFGRRSNSVFPLEYIIEDPTVLDRMQRMGSSSSDDEQTPMKNRFAQIKAKFEQKPINYVMESPSSSSTTTASTHKPSDDLYAKHRRSQSSSSDKSKPSTLRRLDSADEDDEEVQRIHRQGEHLRRHSRELSPISSANEAPVASRVQYEVLDEDGNPMAIDGVHDLIQMSGARAREVTQPDGTVVKEYVIDDPQILSKFRPQSTEKSSPMASFAHAPPPPPRVPLRQPMLFRPPGEHSAPNIQQISVLEPQRRYEFVTSAGRRVQFLITQISDFHGQPISDGDLRELSQAIHSRLGPSTIAGGHPPPFTNPKPWFPSVDLTQRAGSANRQRIGSDSQEIRQPMPYQQVPVDLARSASYGALNQIGQPTVNWNSFRQQRPQSNGPVQTSAQFLPQQQFRTTSTVSPPVYQQQQPEVRYVQSYGQARI